MPMQPGDLQIVRNEILKALKVALRGGTLRTAIDGITIVTNSEGLIEASASGIIALILPIEDTQWLLFRSGSPTARARFLLNSLSTPPYNRSITLPLADGTMALLEQIRSGVSDPLAILDTSVNAADRTVVVQDQNGTMALLSDLAAFVTGPAGGTDEAVCRYDGGTGLLIQNSLVLINDSGDVTGIRDISISRNLNGRDPDLLVAGPGLLVADNRLARWNGTSGTDIQSSLVTLDDSGNLTGIANLNGKVANDLVTGPASATANAIAKYNGTTGKVIQNSGITISAANSMVFPPAAGIQVDLLGERTAAAGITVTNDLEVNGELRVDTIAEDTAANGVDVDGVLIKDGAAELVNPVGAAIQWLGSDPPAGYLECNGQEVSRSTYATLFAAIGTTYGAGDGSTTFDLPDLTGEFV